MIDSIANYFHKLFQPLPRIDRQARSRVAHYLWIAAGVLTIILAIYILNTVTTIQAIERASAVIAFAPGVWIGAQTRLYLTLILLTIQAALLASAVLPLRDRAARGWKLAFAVAIVNLASNLISFVVGVLSGYLLILELLFPSILVCAMIYILLETREFFHSPIDKSSSSNTPK